MTFAARLFNRHAADLFVRNTIVSVLVFTLDMILLVILVEQLGMEKVSAVALAFVVAATIHYVFGRAWIFRGSERGLATGYLYFLLNAGIGFAITLALFWGIADGLGVQYLVARVLASVVSGLTVFVLNAVLNFRCL